MPLMFRNTNGSCLTENRLCKSNILLNLAILLLAFSCNLPETNYLKISKDSHIVLIGNNLGSRMMNYGFFETEVQLKFPDSALVIRNMCDGGNTPGFRPHSGRESPWAFPGADQFYTELAKNSGSQGHLETPDQWLTNLQADVIIALFGYNESFQGADGVDRFKDELKAFIKGRLAPFKYPRWIEFVTALPKTATGKIQRFKLRS